MSEQDGVSAAEASPGQDERLPSQEKLRRRAEFERCYKSGRRLHGTVLTVHFVPNSLDRPRLGITVTRKVGGAVTRQRLKRQVREVYRRWSERSRLPAVDMVVHAKPGAGEQPFSRLARDLESLLSRLLRARDPIR